MNGVSVATTAVSAEAIAHCHMSVGGGNSGSSEAAMRLPRVGGSPRVLPRSRTPMPTLGERRFRINGVNRGSMRVTSSSRRPSDLAEVRVWRAASSPFPCAWSRTCAELRFDDGGESCYRRTRCPTTGGTFAARSRTCRRAVGRTDGRASGTWQSEAQTVVRI